VGRSSRNFKMASLPSTAFPFHISLAASRYKFFIACDNLPGSKKKKKKSSV
jgi:hypothetical protein